MVISISDMEIQTGIRELDDWTRMVSNLSGNHKVILWGTGNFAKLLKRYLISVGIPVDWCVDSFLKQSHHAWEGIDVFTPSEILRKKEEFDVLVIIASSSSSDIATTCETFGLVEFRDFVRPINFSILQYVFNVSDTIGIDLGELLGPSLGRQKSVVPSSGKCSGICFPQAISKIGSDTEQIYIDRSSEILPSGETVVVNLNPGKVGSSTIHQSLLALIKKKNLPWALYNLRGMSLAPPFGKYPARMNVQDYTGYLFRQVFEENRDEFDWRFVNGVRDPVAWLISTYYQNNYVQHGHPSERDLWDYAGEVLPYYLEFNDSHYRDILGVDVHAADFDFQTGFSIHRSGNLSVLTYRLDRLTDNFSKIMETQFGISTAQMVPANIAQKKDIKTMGISYSESYKITGKSFKMPSDVLDRIYSKRSVQHFFSASEIDGFIQRWSQ